MPGKLSNTNRPELQQTVLIKIIETKPSNDGKKRKRLIENEEPQATKRNKIKQTRNDKDKDKENEKDNEKENEKDNDNCEERPANELR